MKKVELFKNIIKEYDIDGRIRRKAKKLDGDIENDISCGGNGGFVDPELDTLRELRKTIDCVFFGDLKIGSTCFIIGDNNEPIMVTIIALGIYFSDTNIETGYVLDSGDIVKHEDIYADLSDCFDAIKTKLNDIVLNLKIKQLECLPKI